MTFAEAAETVLADTRRAMTATELWAEIERRGLVETTGKTPSATLYTTLMRKSANWRSDDDDREPQFYRNGRGGFGRWADLAPEQRKAILASADAPSPTQLWRELYDRVKDDPNWRDRIADLAAKRATAGAELAAAIRAYVDHKTPLETLRAALDQRSRTDWGCFGFSGTSFAMMLNMIAKAVVTSPSLEPGVRAAMAVPADEAAARERLRTLSDALHTLREAGNKRQLPHPGRIPPLFSALWHVQAPEVWRTYYKSARDALDETGVVSPSEDPIESYLAFRGPYQRLAADLGASPLELEQLCRLQQETSEESDSVPDDDDSEPAEAAAWLFQCRPDFYDLRGAVEQLTDLTWAVRAHRKRIHEGDTVYLWESGTDAALIASGTITSEPASLPEDPAQRPFYRDPTADTEEAVRVRLHIDRVVRPPLTRQQILAAPALADVQLFRHIQGTNFRLVPDVMQALEALIGQAGRGTERRYWKIAPGRNAEEWPAMEHEGVIAVSWNQQDVGDLRNFANKSQLEAKYAAQFPELSEPRRRSRVDQLWAFREIATGDVILANRGYSRIVGEGIVTGGYYYRPDHPFPHARPVRWERRDEREIEDQGPRWRPTVVPVTAEQYEALFDDEPPPQPREPPPTAPDEPPPLPPYTLQDALKQVFLSNADLTRLVDLLQYKRNLVLQGPPGVGKTFVAAELAYLLLGARDEKRIRRVQFHPSYAYEDFVRGYRPVAGGFEYRDGPMLTFCEQARRDDRPHVMIVDEINRGNLSKILGELMLLIESDKRDARWHVELAYTKPGEPPFWMPPNVYLIGTMNTADRSIALVDYALRRRFVFATLSPAFSHGGFEQHLESRGVADALRAKIVTRITQLNAEIEKDTRNLGAGYVIGHSYFCQRAPRDVYDDAWYEQIVRCEIEPLLNEYWAENLDKARTAVVALLRP